MHAGMDLGHPDGAGTPVLNVQSGVVERVISDVVHTRAFDGYGNGVVVHHPTDDTWALYAHMQSVDVAVGQSVPAGTRLGAMGNTSNSKFPGMGAHLHLELRHRRPSGESPFPGPYPQSTRNLFNNMDPRPWLEGKGLRFLGRGGFEILPATEMDATRSAWTGLGLGGYALASRCELAGLGVEKSVSADGEGSYEPPARFDRDVRFGLTPIEWVAIGTGVLLLTGTAVGLVVRSKLRPRVTANLRRRRTSRH